MTSKIMRAHNLVSQPLEEIYSVLSANPQLLTDEDESRRFLLHWAALAGKKTLCEHILQRHPDQRDANDDTNGTPLIMATHSGDLPTVTLFVRAGADIDHCNSGGHSALQYACSRGKIEIVRYLLDMHANVNVRDEIGNTPLHRAVSKGWLEIAELLLSNGANPNIGNMEGNTPLHLACEENDHSSAVILIRRGANRNMLNANEKTPYELAPRSLCESITAELNGRHAG